ncbi:dihydrolipoyl dehydrogenase [Levilactobacillus namurensis]|uniref:dihydrolipoyl dehydrogenase n=1 Tax=Levilactobacillus namurensis TaxID=380393 RepID=UPI002232A7F3|nr:dihydrolipoyl dehydrogenase [Levilactobacillus namurensis]MCW3778060.1 dihydrolipoyl dehydrogenase [Levilactobacillus namurensis]MDT7018408.1 dihydrolipoyl dehydrogenase [Levilactobacillus namurensis]WNN64606.1 dihydrolipoyl dehydrogenase [Levilactobacillus namurensis]
MADVEKKDTVIIGAGPGGYVAAIRASELGQKVTLVEKSDTLGGVCLNVGCVPSKALIQAGHRLEQAKDGSTYGISTDNATIDFKKTQEWKQKKVVNRMTSGVKMLMKKHHVDVVNGEAVFLSDTQLRVIPTGEKQFMSVDTGATYEYNNIIIASGSHPIEIPGFKFEGRVVDSTGGLNLPEIPKEFVVIGGGYVGTELAGAYASLGAHVTIIEGTKSILAGFDKDLVSVVLKKLKKKGVDVITNAMAKGSKQDDNGVEVTYAVDGKESTVKADYCMVTVGRKPNTDNLGLEYTGVKMNDHGQIEVDNQGRTASEHIWAIGDCVPGPALAHKAFAEAKTAAGAIAGKKTANDWVGVPAVCFSDPEITTVGYSKSQATDKGIKVKTAQFPFAGNARAVSLDAPDGFVRFVYTDDDNKNIVGAQAVGPEVSTMAGELSIIVNDGLNVEDVALTIHPHPTLNEPIQETADIALGFPTHI